MKTALIGFAAVAVLVVAAIVAQPDRVNPVAALAVAQTGPGHNHDAPEPTKPEPAEEETQEERYMYFEMKTSLGTIYLELDNELAPITVANFLSYVEDGHYNGTIFHRVMANFMIQGGGFDKDMKQKKVKASIKNEWKNGLSNMRGTIAMARLGRQPDSATAQFFINVVDNKGLDMPRDGAGYAVFGKVVKGMEVVDEIRKVAVGNKGQHGNVPIEPVIIETVILMDDAQIEEAELLESTETDE